MRAVTGAPGRDWEQEDKGTTENEMARWHHRLDGWLGTRREPGRAGAKPGGRRKASSLGSQEADQVVWYSHLVQNVPQFIVIHTVKSFGIVNKAEIDVFLELSCFFHDPVDMLAI